MIKKNEQVTKKDFAVEGRDVAYMDIDRMINEGLAGGNVYSRHDTTNIEEALDLFKEEPPFESS